MKILILYFVVLGFICIRDLFKVRNLNDFIVAGKRQTTPFVFMSLMATILGASATIGVAQKVYSIGFSAFFWLAVGSIGLLLQGLILSKKVNRFNVKTMPELAEKTVGIFAKKLVGIIIVVSWIGIIAAQFSAIAAFLSLVIDIQNSDLAIIITSFLVILYTLLGGQLSVVKTDALQFFILSFSFIAAFIYLMGGFSGTPAMNIGDISLFNEKFAPEDFVFLLFTVGGAYFLGPDILSRNFIAKDANVAKRAVLIGSVSILFFSFIVVFLGLWVKVNVAEIQNPLFYITENVLPLPLAIGLAVGLLSALLSSADTCLINSAAILGNDILNTKRIAVIRILVGVIGFFALLLALCGKDIIELLTMTYSVYTPGIVAPLAIAILSYEKFELRKKLWYAGIFLGGFFGIFPSLLSFFSISFLNKNSVFMPLLGIAISFLFALFSLKRKQ